MQNIIKDEIPDVYVHRIMIGPNIVIDTVSGFFRDTNRQVDIKIDKLSTFCLTLLTRCIQGPRGVRGFGCGSRAAGRIQRHRVLPGEVLLSSVVRSYDRGV